MRKIIIMMAILFLGFNVSYARGEHPGEHPGKVLKEPVEEIKSTVKKYVDDEVAKKGSFKIMDSMEKGKWILTYEKPHPVRKIDDAHYFLCADFKGYLEVDGKKVKDAKLDLDFFLEKKGVNWNVTKVCIHKVNNKVREQKYYCTMHKDVKCWEKIKCPVCNMNMEEVK
jgi:hypothetical protein